MHPIVNSKDYEIRYSELKEKEQLKAWVSHPHHLKWYPPTLEQEVEIFCNNWIGYSRFHCSLSAFYKNEPCGIGTLFLMPFRKLIHLSLCYLVVAPEFQKKGVGTSLIKNLKHLSKTFYRQERVYFEVFEGCPIIHLLEKQGFVKVFKQDDFAKVGDEQYLARVIYEAKL